MLIDAESLVAGRLSTFIAKKALLGGKIDVINSEKAIIVGNKKNILAKYKWKREMGDTFKGPYLHRSPERILKRIVRGMLPYKQKKGRDAFERIKCYNGVPEEFKGKKGEPVKEAGINLKSTRSYLTLKEISKFLGGK